MVRIKFKPNNITYKVMVDDPDMAIKVAYTVLECRKEDILVISYNKKGNKNEKEIQCQLQFLSL